MAAFIAHWACSVIGPVCSMPNVVETSTTVVEPGATGGGEGGGGEGGGGKGGGEGGGGEGGGGEGGGGEGGSGKGAGLGSSARRTCQPSSGR